MALLTLTAAPDVLAAAEFFGRLFAKDEANYGPMYTAVVNYEKKDWWGIALRSFPSRVLKITEEEGGR